MVDKLDADFVLDDDEMDKDFGFLNEENNDADIDNDADMDEYIVRIFGLDNAGKSTLMLNLIKPKEGNVAELTEDFDSDIFIYKNSKIDIWDISGKKDYRECWQNYFHSSDGFIFVIDISNFNRHQEAHDALNKIILSEKDNHDIPLLIYANKDDKLEKPLKEDEVFKILGIEKNENRKVQLCSAKKIRGLQEGFEWLFNKIKM